MIVDELKKSILSAAICGKFSLAVDSDTSVDKMIVDISKVREKSIKLKISKNDKYKPVDEKMIFDIPSNWRWIRLGEIGNWGSGSTPERANTDYYKNGTISWLKTGELTDGYVFESNEKITELALKKCSLKINKPGDILIAMYGATIGKLGIATMETTTNQACCGCSIYTNVNNKYLFYYLLGIRGKIISMGEGSGQPNISREKIINFPFPLPPLEEQQRIVDKIECLFAKLDEIKPIETELISMKTNLPKELNKSIIDYAIHGYLTSQLQSDSDVLSIIPDRSTCLDNYHKFNLELSENEYPFSIPENWKWVKLGMLFNYQNGYAYKPSETSKNGIGIPVIKSQNIMKRVVEINNKTAFVENPTEQMLKSRIIKGDFLMCLSSQSNNPEPLGKTAIYNEDDYALLNQRVLKLTPINTNLSKYMYYVINSFYFHNTVSHKGGGSAQSNLKLEHVMEMYIPLPPIEEQQRIVDKLEQLLPLCDEIESLI